MTNQKPKEKFRSKEKKKKKKKKRLNQNKNERQKEKNHGGASRGCGGLLGRYRPDQSDKAKRGNTLIRGLDSRNNLKS